MEKKKIEQYRKKIDGIDENIISLLEKRFKYVETIGKIKKQLQYPVEDKKREKEILSKIKFKRSPTLPSKFIKTLFSLIMEESKKQQYSFDKKDKNC
jgi:chorismate mutase